MPRIPDRIAWLRIVESNTDHHQTLNQNLPEKSIIHLRYAPKIIKPILNRIIIREQTADDFNLESANSLESI